MHYDMLLTPLLVMNLNNLTDEALTKLFEEINPENVNIMEMTVGEVLTCILNTQSLINYAEEHRDTVLDKLAFIKGFINKSNALFNSLNKYNNDISPEYNQAVLEIGNAPSTAETIITDLVEWYHLHSTKEAEELPFSDWYIMKRKEAYNGAVERRTQSIINRKHEQQMRRQ